MKIAEIGSDNLVKAIFDWEFPWLPVYSSGIYAVDVTEVNPTPVDGMRYDPVAKTFSPGPPPKTVRILSKFEFGTRFTAEERIAIRTAGQTDPAVADYLELSTIVDEVSLDNPTLAMGIAMLVSKNLLTQERATAILA